MRLLGRNDIRARQFAREKPGGMVGQGGHHRRINLTLRSSLLCWRVNSQALVAVKGGNVVCGGIHMSNIPSFSYDLLWEERSVCSVANLTRQGWQ